MELIDRERKVYGPPARLDAKESYSTVLASYGPTQWEEMHLCTVNGVKVQKTRLHAESRRHVLCIFPDGREMFVAEKNIRAKKVGRRYGEKS